MIKIGEQIVDSEDVCEAVLGKVFGEDTLCLVSMNMTNSVVSSSRLFYI